MGLRVRHEAETSTPPRVDIELTAQSGPWTFGRHSDRSLRLNAQDTGVSRAAGEIKSLDRDWLVTNDSTSKTLLVDRIGWPRVQLTPGDTHRLKPGVSTIAVVGDIWTYRITVNNSNVEEAVQAPDDTVLATSRFEPTSDDLLVVAALAHGYFQPVPRYQPEPLSYQQAAELIGVKPTALRRRVDKLRGRLVNNFGFVNADARDFRRQLVEFFLTDELLPTTLFHKLMAPLAQQHADPTEDPS